MTLTDSIDQPTQNFRSSPPDGADKQIKQQRLFALLYLRSDFRTSRGEDAKLSGPRDALKKKVFK